MSEKEDIKSVLKSLVFFVLLALFFRASALAAYKIPSSSMEDTLQIGDHIFVNKLSYGFRLPFMTHTILDYDLPERGDIVVFTLPENSSIDIIKRVIALPGDEIEVLGKKVFINGKEYVDDARYAIWREGGLRDFGPVIVPPDHVILLGDNRDHSRDSRFWDSPFLPRSRIVGRAFVIWWNWSKPKERMFTMIR
ncbi:MAG TPA: signal peptidase I [Oligoflexia bacterium]|nr:signal peptidase I [Oligoflexia bacterium]HMP49490.1 signal peptidase I [Oligoflexia bacterium]